MSKTKSPVKRIVITIFLCIIVMAITKTFVYINIAYPNMEDSLFVPITVKDVPDSEDIVVDMPCLPGAVTPVSAIISNAFISNQSPDYCR